MKSKISYLKTLNHFTLKISILLILVSNSITAQNITTSEKFNIQFSSTEYLREYKNESPKVIGCQNNNFAVDIEKIIVKKSVENKLADLKFLTRKIALDFGLSDLGLEE